MNTQQKRLPAPTATITMRDVYYVLFRHKWKITILTVLGLLSSFGVYSFWPFPYVSRAKVFIRYVQDAKPPTDIDSATRVQTTDNRSGSIMNTELQVLTSMDLAVQVATNMKPETILGKGNSNELTAASFIAGNLTAEIAKDSQVVILEFKANDSTIVRRVLLELISAYKDKYKEIHLTPGFTDDALNKEKDEANDHLTETMKTLEDEKRHMGITSLEDAKKAAADQRAKTTESIYEVKGELAQIDAIISDLRERIAKAMTNGSIAAQSTNIAVATPTSPSPDVLSKYRGLTDLLGSRRVAEQNMLSQFNSDSNPLVRRAQQLREMAESNVMAFEAENPGLVAVRSADLNRAGLAGASTMNPMDALSEALSKQRIYQAKYNQLTNQFAEVLADSGTLDVGEDKITKAETEMKVADAKYEHILLAAEQARIDETLGAKISNINTLEMPTPPSRDSKQVLKATLGVLGFFLVLAFGLPFFIELVLDQSFRNPIDVQARIAMPFFINIPRTNGHGKLPKLKQGKEVPLLKDQDDAATPADVKEQSLTLAKNGKVAAWDERHELRPFFETLRDRLMTYFEMINLTHKPKLVAVTSCGPGAGVTTTAAGLASSLSEIGEGNVLLVSMNVRDGEAQHFYKGKLTRGIEDMLEKGNREQAQVQNNLFVAKEIESDDRLPRVLPKRFSHLVPMMKASDYDYIIFDMPPVSEISITPRLARFMDMVLLVIESEKTSRDVATRAASLLAESKTHVGMVLNKTRSYMPKKLEQTL